MLIFAKSFSINLFIYSSSLALLFLVIEVIRFNNKIIIEVVKLRNFIVSRLVAMIFDNSLSNFPILFRVFVVEHHKQQIESTEQ